MDYPKAVSQRFMKSNMPKKPMPGVVLHSGRAPHDKLDYIKSSAMSDTSETPSLGMYCIFVFV